MPVRHKFRPRVARQSHIKFLGITKLTETRYKNAVKRFFEWRKSSEFDTAQTHAELDLQLSEFINFLYQDERPTNWAGDCLAGFKRFYPACRRKLETACAYYKNWLKATKRIRALPLSPSMVQAMASFCMISGRVRLGAGLLLCFAGLLRVGELINLRLGDINCIRDNWAVLTLPDSKGAKREGKPESVIVRDVALIRMLFKCKAEGRDSDPFYGGCYRDVCLGMCEAASFFHFAHPNLTPHGLRRGGATWHFTLYFSYDRTQAHGRWKNARNAKLYIDEAGAEVGQSLVPENGRPRFERLVKCLPELMGKHF
jgi:integrase